MCLHTDDSLAVGGRHSETSKDTLAIVEMSPYSHRMMIFYRSVRGTSEWINRRSDCLCLCLVYHCRLTTGFPPVYRVPEQSENVCAGKCLNQSIIQHRSSSARFEFSRTEFTRIACAHTALINSHRTNSQNTHHKLGGEKSVTIGAHDQRRPRKRNTHKHANLRTPLMHNAAPPASTPKVIIYGKIYIFKNRNSQPPHTAYIIAKDERCKQHTHKTDLALHRTTPLKSLVDCCLRALLLVCLLMFKTADVTPCMCYYSYTQGAASSAHTSGGTA